MSKKLRLFLSTLAISFGVIVVGVSLISASQVSSHQTNRLANQRLYIGMKILPDHLLYPVLVGVDKVKLELAEPEERIYMEVEYGQRRLEYAQELLKKNNVSLASSTLLKSQAYFNSALQESLDNQYSLSAKKFLVKATDYQLEEVTKLLNNFSDADKATLNKVINDSKAMNEKLRKQL